MLDKTDDLDPTLDVPAISVQLSSTIGGTRSLTLTTGLPMDCKKSQLDELLDKITAASDRQKKMFDLEQTRLLLKNEEQNLHQHRLQHGNQEIAFARQWESSNRKGETRLTASQQNTLDGLQKNIANSAERIEKLRADIVKMEQECR
jgi:hypothetical protein